jgi:hypothetical protein
MKGAPPPYSPQEAPIRIQIPLSKKMLLAALEGIQNHGVLGSLPNPEFAPQATAGEAKREQNIWRSQQPPCCRERQRALRKLPEAACPYRFLPVPWVPSSDNSLWSGSVCPSDGHWHPISPHPQGVPMRREREMVMVIWSEGQGTDIWGKSRRFPGHSGS